MWYLHIQCAKLTAKMFLRSRTILMLGYLLPCNLVSYIHSISYSTYSDRVDTYSTIVATGISLACK